MNILHISCFLISFFSFHLASPANEHHITFNNDNRLTLKQWFNGTDGVTIKANQPKRTQHDPLLPDEIIPNGVVPLAQESPNITTHFPLNLLATIIQPKVIIGAIAIAYGTLMAHLLYTSRVTLAKNDTWASWRLEIPNNLLTQAEATIAKDLYTDIQAHYANQKDTALFLSPLFHFINEVNAQITQLEQFIKLHTTLTYYKIALIFPAQEKALAQAAQKIERLEILKHFMVKSISQYKVA